MCYYNKERSYFCSKQRRFFISVKNIARNLFVSGVLALSGGVVCGKPVSADCESDLKLAIERNEKILDLNERVLKLMEVTIAKHKCLEDYANCMQDVTFTSSLASNDTSSLIFDDNSPICISRYAVRVCKNQLDECREKITAELL